METPVFLRLLSFKLYERRQAGKTPGFQGSSCPQEQSQSHRCQKWGVQRTLYLSLPDDKFNPLLIQFNYNSSDLRAHWRCEGRKERGGKELNQPQVFFAGFMGNLEFLAFSILKKSAAPPPATHTQTLKSNPPLPGSLLPLLIHGHVDLCSMCVTPRWAQNLVLPLRGGLSSPGRRQPQATKDEVQRVPATLEAPGTPPPPPRLCCAGCGPGTSSLLRGSEPQAPPGPIHPKSAFSQAPQRPAEHHT